MDKLLNWIKILWKKGIAYIFLGNLLNKFTVFFGSVVLVRILTKNMYGELTYIENLYGYVYIFAGLGLSNAAIRFIVLEKSREKQYGIYTYLIKQGTIYNVLLLFLFSTFLSIYPHPQEFLSIKELCYIYILVLPFQYILDVNFWTERAFFQNKRYVCFTSMLAIMSLIAKITGAYLNDLFWVISFFLLVNIFLSFWCSSKTKKKHFFNIGCIKLLKEEKKKITKFSLQYMLTNSLWSIFMLNDTFFLARLLKNSESVAEYKAAYVIPGSLAILSLSIGVFVTPYFIKHENDLGWIRKNYWYTLGGNIAIMAGAAVIISLFSEEIIEVLYGEDYLTVIPIMKLLLVVVFINNGFRYTTANLLSALGKIKGNLIVSIIGIVIQIFLDILWIPKFGAFGAVYANLVAYIIMSIILFMLFDKAYGLIFWKNRKGILG